MPNAVTHPDPRELAAFGHGKLSEAAATAIANHLEACSACRQVVASLPPDTFLGKVRAAKPGMSTLPPTVKPAEETGPKAPSLVVTGGSPVTTRQESRQAGRPSPRQGRLLEQTKSGGHRPPCEMIFHAMICRIGWAPSTPTSFWSRPL